MSVFRKLAVVLLAMAIAPAMAMSGLPIKYCNAAAGQHQALEFVLDGLSHAGDHESHEHAHLAVASHADDCEDGDYAEPGICTDTSLLALAPVACAEPQLIALTGVGDSELPKSEPSADLNDDLRTLVDAQRLRSDPRLYAHRTIVLRI